MDYLETDRSQGPTDESSGRGAGAKQCVNGAVADNTVYDGTVATTSPIPPTIASDGAGFCCQDYLALVKTPYLSASQ